MSNFDDAKRKAIDWADEEKVVYTGMAVAERTLLWMLVAVALGVGYLAGKFF